MNFTDFRDNPTELIGKLVLYSSGMSYSSSLSGSIKTIDKITKTGFRITDKPDALFSFIDGYQKGLTGRQNMGTISQCKLITEQESIEIKNNWAMKKKVNEMRKEIGDKLMSLTFEQLQDILKIINTNQ